MQGGRGSGGRCPGSTSAAHRTGGCPGTQNIPGEALHYTDYRGQFKVLIRLKSHLYQHHVDCVGEGEDHGQEEDTEEVTPAHPHEAGGGGGGKDDDGDEAYDDADVDLLLAVQSKE